ncbi:glycosyltransferase family 4 protein [Aquiflexum sp.]|uniref:glycosyltransferase family 4 protein n=1 Tax=Aquiflexum sp. TaxID=1872584 RepID=UPI0035942802
MKKILFLPKYPRMGASSRLRTYQFLPLWEEAGYGVRVDSFFNKAYLKDVYRQRVPGFWNVLGCYFKRMWVLMGVWRYDMVLVEKELFPYLPAWAEWLLAYLGPGYVVDYDDAVFHRYDTQGNFLVRNFLGKKIDRVMRRARTVFAGNGYLAQRAKEAGAKSVVLLPTVIDPKRYRKKEENETGKVWIGWIGSPSTLKYVKEIKDELEEVCLQANAGLLLVNGNLGFGFKGDLRVIPWTEEGEVDAILQMDIGVMPLPDNEWERGKCAYKLIQYMACGLPVVASPVGMNNEVVGHGENGFLASGSAEWKNALLTLIQDAALRKKMGENGYELVQERFTLRGNFGVMVEEVRG